jgi:hypothetical protein
MKGFIWVLAVILIVAGQMPSTLIASDTGCKIVLCLSNPGGPKEYAECHEPIDVLKNCLKRHKPIPKCTEAAASFGREYFYPCEESYGGGYTQKISQDGYSGELVCAKVVRYENYYEFGMIPIYDEKPVQLREKTRYMETETGRYYFDLD